jgi:hypothetical protein
MKRKNRLLPITLCVSAVFHIGAFLSAGVLHFESFAEPPEPEWEWCWE